jgi:5,10-methylenetetrahydromethanopterin reductase
VTAAVDLSCTLAPGRDTVAHIELAEALGYRRAWCYDSPALYRDVWMTLAVAATRTTSIGLGVGVTVPGLRHVVVTASAVATLEDEAPGRVAVGVGTGFTARWVLGQPPQPWREVERFVTALRGLLRGDVVDVDGALVQLRQPEGFVAPRPIATPILVAAAGPKGRAVARALGDGVIAMGAPCTDVAWSVHGLTGTVLDPGEDRDAPRVAEALGAAAAFVYHYAYVTDPALLDHLPGGAGWRAAIEEVPPEIRHLALHDGHLVAPNERERPHVRPEAAATAFVGSADELVARLDALRDAGVTEVVYAPMGPDLRRELTAVAEAAGRTSRPTTGRARVPDHAPGGRP